MKVLLALVLASLSAAVLSAPALENKVNFKIDEEWYVIPKVDGTLKLMSKQDIFDDIQNDPTPLFVPETDVIMILYTRANPSGTRVNIGDSAALVAGGFNAADPVRLTAHGWNGAQSSGVNAVSQYLAAGNFNHFVVDWSAGAGTINYISARNRVPTTAQFLGDYIRFLIENGSATSRIYTVGHSLGGQMAGLTGQYLDPSLGPLAACVCLDPAGPLFSNTDPDDRASPDDCTYVESIHTNGWLLGIGIPISHADFYPNGGRTQPGCGIDISGQCAHARAHEFFRESLITSLPFMANQCTGTVDDIRDENCQTSGVTTQMMGDPVNYNARGLFHLVTADSSPFVLPL